MKTEPTSAEINGLFANNAPDEVWFKAINIVCRISPEYDFTLARTVFDDVMRLFQGEYPGYCAIQTLYHDLPHTLDVFICSVRLMHGVHLSGTCLNDDEITQVMIAALMHDVGYAQLHCEKTGTGAQFTQGHVRRGIEFLRNYLIENDFPDGYFAPLEPMMLSTELALSFPDLDFPDERARLLGKIVGTADLGGQMADRSYLEKLLFLFLEFKEARVGNFKSVHDLLCQTEKFYAVAWKKLDHEFAGIYDRLTFHFMDSMGIERNYYLESIEKNLAYLSKVIALDETEYLSMLKRGGIVERSKTLALPE